MVRSVLTVLSPAWKWLLDFSVPPFFFLLGLPMLCLFSAFPPQNACCQQDNHLCFLFLQMHWKSWSSGCMWCITRLKMKTKAIAARLCFLRCSENYSSVILSGAGVFWSAHLCTSIHLNLLFVNPLFLTSVALNLSISKTALPDIGSDFCVQPGAGTDYSYGCLLIRVILRFCETTCSQNARQKAPPYRFPVPLLPPSQSQYLFSMLSKPMLLLCLILSSPAFWTASGAILSLQATCSQVSNSSSDAEHPNTGTYWGLSIRELDDRERDALWSVSLFMKFISTNSLSV